MPKCKPSKYNVITSSGGVEYGFRCHHIWAVRFKTELDRKMAMKDHRRSFKKKSKQK